MIYVIGFLGFVSGFALGIYILKYLLRDRSADDLLKRRDLKWTYGLFVWILAGGMSYVSVQLYGLYF